MRSSIADILRPTTPSANTRAWQTQGAGGEGRSFADALKAATPMKPKPSAEPKEKAVATESRRKSAKSAETDAEPTHSDADEAATPAGKQAAKPLAKPVAPRAKAAKGQDDVDTEEPADEAMARQDDEARTALTTADLPEARSEETPLDEADASSSTQSTKADDAASVDPTMLAIMAAAPTPTPQPVPTTPTESAAGTKEAANAKVAALQVGDRPSANAGANPPANPTADAALAAGKTPTQKGAAEASTPATDDAQGDVADAQTQTSPNGTLDIAAESAASIKATPRPKEAAVAADAPAAMKQRKLSASQKAEATAKAVNEKATAETRVEESRDGKKPSDADMDIAAKLDDGNAATQVDRSNLSQTPPTSQGSAPAAPAPASDTMAMAAASQSNAPAPANLTATPAVVAPPPPPPAHLTEAEFAEQNHPAIVQTIHGSLLPKGGSMQIRLDPPGLGPLQISVKMENGTLNATLQTSDATASSLLSHSLSQLKHTLETQGITVERLQVQQMSKQENASTGQQNAEEHSQQQQHAARDGQGFGDEQRRETLRRLWEKVRGGDPLDVLI